jgi:hypothetical protein
VPPAPRPTTLVNNTASVGSNRGSSRGQSVVSESDHWLPITVASVLAQSLCGPIACQHRRRFRYLVKDEHKRAALLSAGSRKVHGRSSQHDDKLAPARPTCFRRCQNRLRRPTYTTPRDPPPTAAPVLSSATVLALSRIHRAPILVPERNVWRPIRSEPYHRPLLVSLIPEIELERAVGLPDQPARRPILCE